MVMHVFPDFSRLFCSQWYAKKTPRQACSSPVFLAIPAAMEYHADQAARQPRGQINPNR
jgi:hypothetical protein